MSSRRAYAGVYDQRRFDLRGTAHAALSHRSLARLDWGPWTVGSPCPPCPPKLGTKQHSTRPALPRLLGTTEPNRDRVRGPPHFAQTVQPAAARCTQTERAPLAGCDPERVPQCQLGTASRPVPSCCDSLLCKCVQPTWTLLSGRLKCSPTLKLLVVLPGVRCRSSTR